MTMQGCACRCFVQHVLEQCCLRGRALSTQDAQCRSRRCSQVRLEQAENRMDLAMVADIKYGALADVEEAIKKKEAERPENPMLAEVVGPDAIAKVHAHIPC